MATHHCPKCGSSEIVRRKVNDLLGAADPSGQRFEIALQLPIWRCSACKLAWEGPEALAAKEAAYQRALIDRLPSKRAA